ncbi:hypothetical protein Goarm_011647 [Gossypium armourianum]|uniref:Uncharacterized protein n=1 Tax=Gossypium armourianum TaxID=34283 RepID=A0A7J9IXG4_9ROSI|nr:hypothetical protein [Gossypium armourianum]
MLNLEYESESNQGREFAWFLRKVKGKVVYVKCIYFM